MFIFFENIILNIFREELLHSHIFLMCFFFSFFLLKKIYLSHSKGRVAERQKKRERDRLGSIAGLPLKLGKGPWNIIYQGEHHHLGPSTVFPCIISALSRNWARSRIPRTQTGSCLWCWHSWQLNSLSYNTAPSNSFFHNVTIIFPTSQWLRHFDWFLFTILFIQFTEEWWNLCLHKISSILNHIFKAASSAGSPQSLFFLLVFWSPLVFYQSVLHIAFRMILYSSVWNF